MHAGLVAAEFGEPPQVSDHAGAVGCRHPLLLVAGFAFFPRRVRGMKARSVPILMQYPARRVPR
jgi:hypothetical protein